MLLHLALDKKTGFPCASLDAGATFISLFPITKIQVEQWISTRMPFDAEKVTEVIQRFEECYVPNDEPGGIPIYPESIKLLGRKPISGIDAESALSIVATNLTLWTPDEFPPGHDVAFPTARSEWGLLLKWLGGTVPDSGEWKDTITAFERIETKELLFKILGQDFELSPIVKGLLKKCLEVISGSERGLPFMRLGVYELISDTKVYEIDRTEGTLEIARPFVAGESKLWPTMEGDGKKPWRAVYTENLPVVAVRSWYSAGNVMDEEKNDIPRAIELSEKEIFPAGETKARAIKPKDHAALKKAVRGRDSTIRFCPQCCRIISNETVKKNGTLYCYTLKNQDGADSADDKSGNITEHAGGIPDEMKSSVIKRIQINSKYIDLLMRHPGKIRSVTLSGFTKAGKSTWLLSLIGTALYPPGNSRLTNLFPDEWSFHKELLSMENPVTDLLTKALENMWIFGDVPQRNQQYMEAIHSPVLFATNRPGPLYGQEKSAVLIFNDIAGEVIRDPQALANDRYYPHVRATKDVIFIHPANFIENAENLLVQFIKGLTSVERNNRRLDPKTINLVFGLSKIDRLKYPVGKDKELSQRNRELFDIFMRNQHQLSFTRKPDELQSYLEGMKRVHFELMEWIKEKYRDLYTATAQFGSVRFCGFSSFGFELVHKGKTTQVEACLPFDPRPVRVIDPLLWLLQDNGVI